MRKLLHATVGIVTGLTLMTISLPSAHASEGGSVYLQKRFTFLLLAMSFGMIQITLPENGVMGNYRIELAANATLREVRLTALPMSLSALASGC